MLFKKTNYTVSVSELVNSNAVLPMKEENEELPVSKGRMFKNLAVVGVAIMLYLFGYLPCRELQGSINIKDGLGTYSLTVQGACNIASELFLPPVLIAMVGLKKSMMVSLVMVTVYYFANFYANWYTMMTAAVISGFGMVPIWAAKGTYLTGLAEQWAKNFNTSVDATASLIFGLFYGFYYFGYVWGNVLSYFILAPSNEPNITETQLKMCGLHFCDRYVDLDSNANFIRPEQNKIYALFGAFIGMAWLGAVIIALFLDNMKRSEAMQQNPKFLILKTLKAFTNPKHLIILPISIQRGILKSFYSTEFTKAYVTCSWGIHNVGLTMMGFGVVCCVSSLGFGRLGRWVGRIPLFVTAFVVHFIVLGVLIPWQPTPNVVTLFFVVPCLLAISNAVWESQVAGMYSILFPDEREVGFTIYAMAEDMGSMIAFAYSATLCFDVKLAIFMVSVGVAFVCYLVTEFKYIRPIQR